MRPMTVMPGDPETQRNGDSLGAGCSQASVLDSPDIYRRLDHEDLLGRMVKLPEQLEAAWEATATATLPPSFARPERVVVLGTGDAGISGSLLRALAVDLGAHTPVFVVRGHMLPAVVNRRSLVLACLASGHADETISALRDVIAAGIPCGVISTGARCAQLAREHRIPAFTSDWESDPRAALGWSLGTLLALCARCGVLSRTARDLPRALDAMRIMRARIKPDVPEARNPAKQLARRLAGRLPLVVGAQALAPVAHRWRTQISENARSWAIADELPEMNHDAHAGFKLPHHVLPLLHAVFLRHASMHERTRLRVDATVAEMRGSGVTAEVLDIPGPSVLAQQLSAVQFGDFVSYYMALLIGVPPSPVDATERPGILPSSFPFEEQRSFREVLRWYGDHRVRAPAEIPPFGTCRTKGLQPCELTSGRCCL